MNPSSRIGPLSAMLSILVLLSSCKGGTGDPSKGAGKGRVTKLAAIIVAKAPFRSPVRGLGSVGAKESVDLRAEAAGRVAGISYVEGAAVKRGQVLVRLDDAETRALRDRAAARSRLASATLARVREQWKVEAASSQQVEVSAADSAVAASELAIAEVALERTRVRAPFDGVAGLCDVAVGQWIPSGQILTRMVSRGEIRIGWALPERIASGLAKGSSLEWRDPGSGHGGRAVVEALDPVLDASTRTRRLRSVCRTGCGDLLPGGSVELEFPGDSAPVVSLPSQVLSGNVEGLAVYVYRGGKAMLAPVEAGRRSIDRVEILSGLSVGDTVLVPGASPPRPGSPVEIAKMLGGPVASGDSTTSKSRP